MSANVLRGHRAKRLRVPLLEQEWAELRLYAARKKIPMSRVLLALSHAGIQAICAGDDPLSAHIGPAGDSSDRSHGHFAAELPTVNP